MNHLIPSLLKKLERRQDFGVLTIKIQNGKVIHVDYQQALKEKEIEELIKQ